MNIHASQSIQTAVELRLIANAAKRFVSPANSRVAINAKQDTVMGSFVQTRDTTRVNWKEAMNILMNTTIKLNNDIPKYKSVSGKYLFSEIIPKGLNLIRMKDSDTYLYRIVNGELLDGVLGKSDIGVIMQKLWFGLGSKISLNFIDNLQQMILNFLMKYGFTIGIKDTMTSEKVHRSVYEIIETKRKECVAEMTEYENDPYVMKKEVFEIYQLTSLSAVQGNIKKIIMDNFNKESGIYIAISSKSSGTDMNAGQIIGCIGQVIVEGKRIQNRFNNRTLPMFAQYDNSPFARGFCHNSFISGLNPMEFFFQVMAGREGVINTAIKTADKPQNHGRF